MWKGWEFWYFDDIYVMIDGDGDGDSWWWWWQAMVKVDGGYDSDGGW